MCLCLLFVVCVSEFELFLYWLCCLFVCCLFVCVICFPIVLFVLFLSVLLTFCFVFLLFVFSFIMDEQEANNLCWCWGSKVNKLLVMEFFFLGQPLEMHHF